MRFNVVAIQLVKERTMTYSEAKQITSPDVAADLLRQYTDGTDRENFMVLCLNSKNKVTGINTVSIGSLNSSVVHPREVFKAAILSNAAAIIVAHNHPSGDTTPSKEDISLTKSLVEAGKVIGIPVLDHIVVGDYYYSFKEHSLM